MLETLNEWREDATGVIHSHDAFKRNDVEQVLNRPAGSPAGRIAVENLVAIVKQKAAQARHLLSLPGARLPENAAHARDLTKIAEEYEKAVAEGEELTDLDTVWGSADIQTKKKITQKIPIPRDKADRLRARLRLDLREQHGPPDDPSGNGGGSGKPK